MTPAHVLRLGGLGLALLLVVPGVRHPFNGSWLDGVNLVFHEAGHVLLMWCGETVTLLGGSLMQLAIPLGCAAAFALRGDHYAAGLVTLWLAHSLASVGAYVADAPTRALDLITGDPDTHDWWQLLAPGGHLDWAAPLSRLLQALALIGLIAGVLLSFWDEVQPGQEKLEA
ncbi:hypothetical protein [Deinococcus navajonensis]|uniref:Peptidase M50B-like protein n=1 Tax=Deinococcus navajonensis TaxID=309884 RepID=A0ABV8XL52_9DEIO